MQTLTHCFLVELCGGLAFCVYSQMMPHLDDESED